MSGCHKQNQPDSLAIRFKNGKPEKLVFVELKSTATAMKGSKSGAISHMLGMRNYVDNPLNAQFLKNRKREAYEIMKKEG